MAKISSLEGKKILDSRGQETIEVGLELDNGISVSVSLPQGVSRGKNEAIYVAPDLALRNLKETIEPALRGMDVEEQAKIDLLLNELDGTSDKSKLGANAILGVSLATARAAAKSAGVPLWKHLRRISGLKIESEKKPRLFINIIEGGLHSVGNLRFQEYLVIPETESFVEAAEIGKKIHERVGQLLANQEKKPVLGDEGGWAANLEGDLKPFEILNEVIAELGLENKIKFGLDAAASNVKLETNYLFSFYKEIIDKFQLFYLEDPFGEEDFVSFSKLLADKKDGLIIAGDDLTSTNLNRMIEARQDSSINGIIIKPNQIGTVSETIEAVRQAKNWEWYVVASHRGGETSDDFIADIAYGVGADGFKLGSCTRPERLAKYSRLQDIEKEVYR